MSLRYVFPCTGRSGSKYISKLMQACGVNCSHEEVYRVSNMVADGTPTDTWSITRNPDNWAGQYDAESSFVLAPFLNDKVCRDARVCHIVRHPLHVIDSWRQQKHFGSFPFMSTFCPVTADDTVSWMAALWVSWNRYIESQDWGTREWGRYQVEQADTDLVGDLGLSIKVAKPSTKTNSIKSKRITTMDDIHDTYVCDALAVMAAEYGYDL